MKTTENHTDPKLNLEGFSEADLKRNAFKTPQGYFENLTPRLMESVRESEELAKEPTFSWGKILVPSFGIAALALAVWFFAPPTENASLNFDTVLASVSVEELTEYADLNASELVHYELVDYNQLAMNESKLTDEDIIEYLEDEEEFELNTLIDEIEI